MYIFFIQTKIMSTTYTISNYIIVSSLNERTIYLKIVDTISYMTYEANLDSKEFRVQFELSEIYKLLDKCFNNITNYNIKFSVNSGVMKLVFDILVEGFLNINFEILLHETIMSNDGQLTMNFNKIEQKQRLDIEKLTKQLEQLEKLTEYLSYAEIYMYRENETDWFAQYRNQRCQDHKFCLSYQTLETTNITLHANGWNYSKIKIFYKLNTLTIQHNGEINSYWNNLENETLEELCLIGLNNLSSIQKLNKFPKLKKLYINSCPISNLVDVLSSYKHKIEFINIVSCSAINNTQLMTYCQKNNIKLELK
jgi:hypothetical protein